MMQQRLTGIVALVVTEPHAYFNGKGQPPLILGTPVVVLVSGQRVLAPKTVRDSYDTASAPHWEPGQVFDADVYWVGDVCFLWRG